MAEKPHRRLDGGSEVMTLGVGSPQSQSVFSPGLFRDALRVNVLTHRPFSIKTTEHTTQPCAPIHSWFHRSRRISIQRGDKGFLCLSVCLLTRRSRFPCFHIQSQRRGTIRHPFASHINTCTNSLRLLEFFKSRSTDSRLKHLIIASEALGNRHPCSSPDTADAADGGEDGWIYMCVFNYTPWPGCSRPARASHA